MIGLHTSLTVQLTIYNVKILKIISTEKKITYNVTGVRTALDSGLIDRECFLQYIGE